MPPCPKCKKEFTSIRQVTRHLNQPLGFCANLQNDIIGTLHPATFSTSVDSTDDLDSHEHSEYGEPQDGVIDPHPPPSEAWDEPGMDVDSDSLPGHYSVSTTSTREYFPEVANAWPGSTTFMADFDQDRYSDERGENLYYPFASRQDWQVALFLLTSGMSMALIDRFLGLELVRFGTKPS